MTEHLPPRPSGADAMAVHAGAANSNRGPVDDPFGFHLAGGPGDVPHRAEMEGLFGHSFASVPATTGDDALAARGIRGVAEGAAVRFADREPGRDVVAHELAHVVQQRQAGAIAPALSSESQPSDAAEVEARAIGDRETLPDKLFQLAFACQTLERNLDNTGLAEELGHQPTQDREAQAAHDGHLRELRRAALAQAQADLAAIPAKHGFERLHREALDAISANQIGSLAINVIALIAASVATSGLAAYSGGAARGFAIVRMGMSAERAAMVGGTVDVGVDAVLTAGVQTALTGDDLGNGTAENILANVGVRAALARFAPLMSALDDEAAALWESGGVAAKGGVVMAKGAVVGAELVTAAGVSYVAQRLVRGQQPPSDDQTAAWFIQGASMAIGRMVATRTTSLQQRLDRTGARDAQGHAKLMKRALAQRLLAEHVTTSGDADGAMRILVENRALLDEEARLLRDLEADPAKAAALGLSPQDRFTFARENAAARAELAKQGMDTMPLRLAGVDEVIPGALWKGSSEQIATAIHQARAVGLAVHVIEVGNRTKRWRIRIGESQRTLDIKEDAPIPTATVGTRRPRPAGVAPEARAILQAQAAAELAKIRVTVAPTPGASRGAYHITHADGRRMAELLPDVEGVETIEYQAGLVVRHGRDEWYFQFDDHAHDLGQATRTQAIQPAAGGLGLPAPNVVTVELWGFRGVRTIQTPGDPHARGPDEWTPTEAKQVKDVKAVDALLDFGHVGISFDGGKTIHALTPAPTKEQIMAARERLADPALNDLEIVKRLLKEGAIFPGQVLDDGQVFKRAEDMANEHGWNTRPTRALVLLDPDVGARLRLRSEGQMSLRPGDPDIGQYGFPKKTGDACDDVNNCATHPRRLGVPIPEPTGNLKDYMPALEAWAEADAPIDARSKEPVP